MSRRPPTKHRVLAGFALMTFGLVAVLASGTIALVRGQAGGGAWALFACGLATIEIGRTIVVVALRGNGNGDDKQEDRHERT